MIRPVHEVITVLIPNPVYRLEENPGRLGVYRTFVYRDDRLILATADRELAEHVVSLLETEDARACR